LLNTAIDGLIVQDLGLLYILSRYFKQLEIHASTQLNTHNSGQLQFLSKFSTARVNLSRELNLAEIKDLSQFAAAKTMQTEVFVHGSYCISFSGNCYFSSVNGANSGNRGRCGQPCRDQYLRTPAGKNFPLNLKDNSAYLDLKDLLHAGVSALKIEGRIKKFDYVYTVVKSYKLQLDKVLSDKGESEIDADLYKVFNRDFSNSYLSGCLDKEMFIDNPRDNSIKHLSTAIKSDSAEELEKAQQRFYLEKDSNKEAIAKIIQPLSFAKQALDISLYGENGSRLKVCVKTADRTFEVFSRSNLADKGSQILDRTILKKRFKSLNNSAFYISSLTMAAILTDVYLAFNELSTIRKQILLILNDYRLSHDHVTVPLPIIQEHSKNQPKLAVLISSKKDLQLAEHTDADLYFELPENMQNNSGDLIDLFAKNKSLIPCFPAILIGKDYTAAVEFLKAVKPNHILSNNSGLAAVASEMAIPWIAGAQLNLINSYSLLSLKENFNCSGAFISNEISQQQIRRIKEPENFELYYCIYQPLMLLSSRQCLFQQISGCENDCIEADCLEQCSKSASITNLKERRFFIEKSAASHNRIYNGLNFLNTEIVNDLAGHFRGFMIDLRDIKTETQAATGKAELIRLFENFLQGDMESALKIKRAIFPTTNSQYINGL
jgi:U32 family peptidase